MFGRYTYYFILTLLYLYLLLSGRIAFWRHEDKSKSWIELTDNSFPTTNISWYKFARLEHQKFYLNEYFPPQLKNIGNICNNSVVTALSQPRLTRQEYDWCLWANDPKDGRSLFASWDHVNNKAEKLKYNFLRCNKLNKRDESCNDVEGDNHIKNWKNERVFVKQLQCEGLSKQTCYQYNSDIFCELENVLIDFSKFRDTSRVNRFGEVVKTRQFDSNFISTDCKLFNSTPVHQMPLSHAYSPKLSSQHCDIVHRGTVILYSHDHIDNFGHTVNDIMSIWRLLWLTGLADKSNQIDLLNVDGMFQINKNHNDEPNQFFIFYKQYFRKLLLARDYRDKTMCIKKLILPAFPNEYFLWEYWNADDKCGTIGPSSLFQRYNLHVRGLYNNTSKALLNSFSSEDFNIVVIVRKESINMKETSSRTSRKYLNLEEIKESLSKAVQSLTTSLSIKHLNIIYQDFNEINFEEQLQLISRTNILIGMHGAGIPHGVHMSIGTIPHCCGVIEIFPAGEFTPIRGYGNMIRRMGLKYNRIDINQQNSKFEGAIVPISQLAKTTSNMIKQLYIEPTCILPTVVEGTYNPNIIHV